MRNPITTVVVFDPTSGAITVQQADRLDAVPATPRVVAGLLRAAAMQVAARAGVNSRDALQEFLDEHPHPELIAAGIGQREVIVEVLGG